MPDASTIATAGPFFEDLRVGQVFDAAPAMTLTEGVAAVHQAIVGDRLRLPLDHRLSHAVLGGEAVLAHPGLVCDVAIGQSTVVTRQVVANLFYRGLAFHRFPVLGDSIVTRTEVVALRQNRVREGRAATGLAVLRMRTADQEGRLVLDFWRCAMLPLRDPGAQTGHGDDLDGFPDDLDAATLRAAVGEWDLAAYRAALPAGGSPPMPGTRWAITGGDVVSGAPELARLTLNVAAAHHDARARGHRLVYGGHTIGLAAAQAVRAMPELVTVVAWHGCDHLAPVFEGDTLTSTLEVERLERLERLDDAGAAFAHLRSVVHATRDDGDVAVLDWRFVGLVA